MTLHSQYIFSLILFTIDNKHLFIPNNELHSYLTRNNTNLHLPAVNLTKFYKGPLISGIKAFNHLPRHLKLLASDVKCFKRSLKRFLYHHSFYTTKEYYELNEDKLIWVMDLTHILLWAHLSHYLSQDKISLLQQTW